MDGRPSSRRATITFIPEAARDLDRLTEAFGINQSDVVNRAVQVYAFLQDNFMEGKVMYVGNVDGTNLERVHIV